MSTSQIIAVLAATAMAGFFATSAMAESIPQQERDQFSGSARPDVDPGASRGSDDSIVKQEQNQFGNDPARDYDTGRHAGGGEDLPALEQEGVPGGDR